MSETAENVFERVCGAVVDGASLVEPGGDALREHTAKAHASELFNLEMYLFLSAIHALDAAHGLIAFQWPDTGSRWHAKRAQP